ALGAVVLLIPLSLAKKLPEPESVS
ncbi:MAG: hypothetical protein ACJA2W_003045, partial [Planctomycetota bacterium]